MQGKTSARQPIDINDSRFTSAFWHEGAVLRVAADQIFLCAGPWTVTNEDQADIGEMDFFSAEITWWKGSQGGVVSLAEFKQLLETKLGTTRLHVTHFSAPAREQFEDSFRLIQGKIQREEIEKAVPIVAATSGLKPEAADIAHCFFHLSQLPSALNVFGFWRKTGANGLADERGIIGATPETLIDFADGIFRTMALAGTCPKADIGTRQPLMKDSKELREHQLVIDDLVARTRSLGWLRQDHTEVLELPTILHLKTMFELTGCNKTPGELVRHLHPTAALGVAPRAYGFRWLSELPDQIDRGWFGAPMTFRYQGRVRTLVAIRSLLWTNGQSKIYAGCGLVAASQLDREWQELQTKIQSVFQMLGLI